MRPVTAEPKPDDGQRSLASVPAFENTKYSPPASGGAIVGAREDGPLLRVLREDRLLAVCGAQGAGLLVGQPDDGDAVGPRSRWSTS